MAVGCRNAKTSVHCEALSYDNAEAKYECMDGSSGEDESNGDCRFEHPLDCMLARDLPTVSHESAGRSLLQVDPFQSKHKQ